MTIEQTASLQCFLAGLEAENDARAFTYVTLKAGHWIAYTGDAWQAY